MKNCNYCLVLVVLMVGGALPVCAQESHWGSPDDATVKLITAKEKLAVDGTCSPHPGLKESLEGDVADDFQGTAPNGKPYGKDLAIAISTDTTNPDRDCQLGDVRVHFFGDAIAVAYGSESSVHKSTGGKWSKSCWVWTDTWLKRSGKWQIVAAQDAELACK